MDAVTKAAEALRRARQERGRDLGPDAVARTVLAAVGYPHQSSDEGTCWCPIAEQAGRERDEARAQRDQLAKDVIEDANHIVKVLRAALGES